MAFNLQQTIQCETPCYQLSHINITVANPFSEAATFRVVLVEMDGEFPAPEKCVCAEPKKTKKNSNSNNSNLSDSCFKRTLAKREAEAAQQNHLVTRMGTKHGMQSFSYWYCSSSCTSLISKYWLFQILIVLWWSVNNVSNPDNYLEWILSVLCYIYCLLIALQLC